MPEPYLRADSPSGSERTREGNGHVDGGFLDGLGEAVAFRLGLPGRRRWADDRRSSVLGFVGLGFIVIVLLLVTPRAIHDFSGSGLTLLGLAAILLWASMRPIPYRSAGITNQIVLDGGVAVLAVALLGPVPAVLFWLVAVGIAELIQRPLVMITVLNVALTSASMMFAAGAYVLARRLLGDTAPVEGLATTWPQGALALSILLAVVIACSYALAESITTELGGRLLTRAFDESLAWSSVASAQILAVALGCLAGFALSIQDPRLALVAVGLPLILAVELVRQVHLASVARRLKRALVRAQTRLATAGDVATVVELVVEAVPSISDSVWVSAVEGEPTAEDVTDPRVYLFRLSPAPPQAASTERWLRTELMPFEMSIRPYELEDLRGLAQTAAAAIGRIEEQTRVNWRADHDALTGLFNRDGLRRAGRASLKMEEGVAALIIDLDGFKSVNDTYGHDRGDQLLADIAQAIVQAAGPSAVVSRWGGDEFVVMLPGEHVGADLSRIGEHIIDAVENYGRASFPAISVSASVGFSLQAPCSATEDGTENGTDIADCIEELITRADTALYSAKRAGRSMVRGA